MFYQYSLPTLRTLGVALFAFVSLFNYSDHIKPPLGRLLLFRTGKGLVFIFKYFYKGIFFYAITAEGTTLRETTSTIVFSTFTTFISATVIFPFHLLSPPIQDWERATFRPSPSPLSLPEFIPLWLASPALSIELKGCSGREEGETS